MREAAVHLSSVSVAKACLCPAATPSSVICEVRGKYNYFI